jgi:predicted nucleic-acid-binding protein
MMAVRLSSEGKVPINQTAWYKKEEATFSDCLVMVRKHCWEAENFKKSAENEESLLIPSEVLNHLVSCLALAA